MLSLTTTSFMTLEFHIKENIVGKDKIACDKQFLLFPQCLILDNFFLNLHSPRFINFNLFETGLVPNFVACKMIYQYNMDSNRNDLELLDN